MINNFIEYVDNEDIETNYMCSFCNNGKLILEKENYIKKQYKWSEKKSNLYDNQGNCYGYDIFSDISLISGILTCNNKNCIEITAFTGEIYGGEIPAFCEEMNCDIDIDSYHLKFLYITPPINIIEIHNEYPEIIKKLLNESFALFFNHSSSCINKLRIIVEEILNNLNIKKENISTKNGKTFRITTHKRILILEGNQKYKEVARYLLAIKWIGNEGSHSDAELSINELLEIYTIIHKALDLIYLNTDEKLRNRVDEINNNKGR